MAKKLQIKTRKKKSNPVAIKKRSLKIKKRERQYTRTCGYCSHYYLGPIVEREKGGNVRVCPESGEAVGSDHHCVCDDYNGDWITCPKVNYAVVRDEHSPLRIKKRRKKEEVGLSSFKIKRRAVGDED